MYASSHFNLILVWWVCNYLQDWWNDWKWMHLLKIEASMCSQFLNLLFICFLVSCIHVFFNWNLHIKLDILLLVIYIWCRENENIIILILLCYWWMLKIHYFWWYILWIRCWLVYVLPLNGGSIVNYLKIKNSLYMRFLLYNACIGTFIHALFLMMRMYRDTYTCACLKKNACI